MNDMLITMEQPKRGSVRVKGERKPLADLLGEVQPYYWKSIIVNGENATEKVKSTFLRIKNLHDELQELMNKLHSKINTTIEKEAQDIIVLYEKKLKKVGKELEMVKIAMSSKDEDKRINSEIPRLESQVHDLEENVRRLAVTCDDQRKEIQQLNAKIEQLTSDISYYEGKLKMSKRENKELQYELHLLEKRLAESVPTEERSPKEDFSLQQNAHKMDSIKLKQPSEYFKVLRENMYSTKENYIALINQAEQFCDELFTRYSEIVDKLKTQIIKEHRIALRMKQEQTEAVSSRTKLECMLRECVDRIQSSTLSPAHLRVREHSRCAAHDPIGNIMYRNTSLREGCSKFTSLRLNHQFNTSLIQKVEELPPKNTKANRSALHVPSSEDYHLYEDISRPQVGLKYSSAIRAGVNSLRRPNLLNFSQRKIHSPPRHLIQHGKLVFLKTNDFKDKLLGRKISPS